MIGRGGDDTVDAAGGRVGGDPRGEAGGTYKASIEDRGGTPEGRGGGQSPRAVGSRERISVFFDFATYAKR